MIGSNLYVGDFGDYQAELYYFFDLQPLKPSLFAKVEIKSYDLIAACVQDNNVNIINKLIWDTWQQYLFLQAIQVVSFVVPDF